MPRACGGGRRRRAALHRRATRRSASSAPILRAYGVDGVDDQGAPLVNIAVERYAKAGLLGRGISYFLGRALLAGADGLQEAAERLAYAPELDRGEAGPSADEVARGARAAHRRRARPHRRRARRARGEQGARAAPGDTPLKYVIVATGNIYDDAVQAKAAAYAGADIVAVIRATAQSLLDYVPHGATTEGYGGTFATQENFKIIRRATDEARDDYGRYIHQTNYSSGLCMAEIAWMAAVERLDMLLNDAMYGILFRDINPCRTFVDQYVSRRIIARSGIVINTGEDNYLTTADAVEKAHTVLASQFINEAFAKHAGVKDEQMGLGHAYEIDPWHRGQLPPRARAGAARPAGVPDATPSSGCRRRSTRPATSSRATCTTRCSTSSASRRTRASSSSACSARRSTTRMLMDRYLSLKATKYVFNTARHLGDEITVKPDGIMAKRAVQVLDEALELLEEVERETIWTAIERGAFADVKRTRTGGKGYAGVVRALGDYVNPILDALEGRSSRCTRPTPSEAPARVRRPQKATAWCSCRSCCELPPSARAQGGGASSSPSSTACTRPLVTTMEPCAEGYTYFVVYGHSQHSVDPSTIDVPEVRTEALTRDEIEHRVKTRLGRKIVVVGACTGSDAHTVGIDAILNYKGYAGDKGLESYKAFEAYNLGAQVENEQLAERALALERRRDPREPDHHAAQLPQGERARARRSREEAGLARARSCCCSADRASITSSRSSSASTRASARARSRATSPRSSSSGCAATARRRAPPWRRRRHATLASRRA